MEVISSEIYSVFDLLYKHYCDARRRELQKRLAPAPETYPLCRPSLPFPQTHAVTHSPGYDTA